MTPRGTLRQGPRRDGLLVQPVPRGAEVAREVAYDAPCHLQHAQKVHAEPLAMLRSIPGLRLRLLPGHDRCCGGAGAYSMLQPEMSGLVLADKIASIRDANPRPELIATGNPGCIMQIGAGSAAGLSFVCIPSSCSTTPTQRAACTPDPQPDRFRACSM
jgi:glycolate oxidase iron-sulfur subunit